MLRYVANDGRRNAGGQLLFGTDASRAIVVGVDGSPDSTAALDLAADEATRRAVPLLVVQAYPGTDGSEPDDDARALVNGAVAQVRANNPDLTIINDAAGGGSLYLGLSGDALVVIGRQFAQSFAGMPPGVVISRLIEQVRCPVVVGNAGASTERPRVVVGVDDSSASLDALRFAARWSARRGLPVEVVHAVPDIDLDGMSAEAADEHRLQVSMWLWDRVGSVARDFPRVPIRTAVAFGEKPGPALVRAADGASMVVVATRVGANTETALGSIGFALVDEAPCPVAIVPRG
jgi:nucleotide-binding universal stress UspA family protein